MSGYSVYVEYARGTRYIHQVDFTAGTTRRVARIMDVVGGNENWTDALRSHTGRPMKILMDFNRLPVESATGNMIYTESGKNLHSIQDWIQLVLAKIREAVDKNEDTTRLERKLANYEYVSKLFSE
jgi:hypothetical protein